VVIELGAGTAIPSVRMFGERQGVPLIRINPDDREASSETRVVIRQGALAALRALDREWTR
jgi:hypothetical protein